MGSNSHTSNLISAMRISSVVPAKVTDGNKMNYELKNMDFAMKLHHLKAIYFFKKEEAEQSLKIQDFKEHMFDWLNLYFQTCGRIRPRENDGRPFIKCNDAGVRIFDGRCDQKTVEECLDMNDHSVYDQLVCDFQGIGSNIGFSPLVSIQFTWFKCGGISVGLCWSHILGDAFSAANFINMLGKIMAGHVPPESLHLPISVKSEFPPSFSEKPFSLKRVENPVGDSWVIANNCKMGTHSFHVTLKQLNKLRSNNSTITSFEILSAMIWKSMAKIRGDLEPKIVTICRKNSNHGENDILANSQVVGRVEADTCVAKTELLELARLVAEKTVDERSLIDKIVEKEEGKADFVVYGANLTFVNLEDANIYGLEVQKQKPIFASYMIGGVGDEGVVLVLPGKSGGGFNGRTLTVTLPETDLTELKNEIENEWGIL